MPVRDHDRERVVREIVRNAARVLGRPAEVLSVATRAGPDGTAHAGVRTDDDGRATWLGASGASELEALTALLTRVVDRANAPADAAAPLAVTPALARAIALLQMSRAELEAAVREEMAQPPAPPRR